MKRVLIAAVTARLYVLIAMVMTSVVLSIRGAYSYSYLAVRKAAKAALIVDHSITSGYFKKTLANIVSFNQYIHKPLN